MDFHGAKGALINNGQVLIVLRDDIPTIPFPNMWDLPGGGREGEEEPFLCLSREIKEEFAIDLIESQVIWKKLYPSVLYPNKNSWFFVVELYSEQIRNIIFGGEGQRWKMADYDKYLQLKNAVVPQQERFRDFLATTTDNKP